MEIRLFLTKNPFICDCQTQEFYKNIQEYEDANLIDRSSMTCSSPPRNRDKSFIDDELKLEDLNCQDGDWFWAGSKWSYSPFLEIMGRIYHLIWPLSPLYPVESAFYDSEMKESISFMAVVSGVLLGIMGTGLGFFIFKKYKRGNMLADNYWGSTLIFGNFEK